LGKRFLKGSRWEKEESVCGGFRHLGGGKARLFGRKWTGMHANGFGDGAAAYGVRPGARRATMKVGKTC